MNDIETEESHISKTYHQILAVAEKYPDLKANETFRELMNNMTETENNIAEYRETYNQTVKTVQ